MDGQKRDFKGIWIPVEVYLDERLNALDKIILMEIDSLDSSEEGCYASNEYIAEFCQCKTAKVTRAISKLKELGYLEVGKFDGRKRFLKSRLTKKISQTNQKDYSAQSKRLDINNNILKKDINNIYIEQKPKKEKYGKYGRVKLTTDEYLRLVNDFGEDFIKNQIELLDEYIESNNNKNKYTNFNLVLRKSIREDWFKTKVGKQDFLTIMKQERDKYD